MPEDKLRQMISKLTGREKELLGLRCQGLQYSEIGSRMLISERTVYFLVANIYEKLGLVNLETRRKRDTAIREVICPALGQISEQGLTIGGPGQGGPGQADPDASDAH